MMRQATRFLAGLSAALLTGILVALAASAAQAQVVRMDAGEGQISGMGHVHLQRPPTHLRMYLQLTGKGKTLEEALAALKERREAVVAQLGKLGVDKSALVFSPPGVDDSLNAQQRRMEVMIAQRMGGRGVKKGAKTAKPPATATTLLTAQWPLAGDTTEKLLLAAEAVREKIKAAELTGTKDAPKLSAEEQEMAEEMAAQNSPNSGNDEELAKPGEPRFMFMARLAPQERQTALAAAFAKAKRQAAELASAAGVGLGPMTGLSETAGGMSGYAQSWRYNPYGRNDEFMQQIAQLAGSDEQQDETMAPKPDGIGFDFVVSAAFKVAPATPQQ